MGKLMETAPRRAIATPATRPNQGRIPNLIYRIAEV
jgi:hypothetical protein